MPDQKPTNLALARIIRDLEKIKAAADAADQPSLGYLIDMALIEARERQAHD